MNPEPSSSPRPTRSSMRQALRSSRMSAASAVVLDPMSSIVENSAAEHCAPPSTTASDKSELLSSPPSKTDGDLSCLMCSTVFQSAVEFEYHIEVHASLCPSLCLRCCRSFNDRRLLYRHLHFKHGIPSRHFKEMDEEVQATSLSSQTGNSSTIVNNGEEDNGSVGNDEDGISRMKQGFLPETSSDAWKMSINRSTDLKMTSVEVNDVMCSSKLDGATTSASAPTPTNIAAATTTTTRKPLKRCQICDKVFQKITDLRHHLTASHSDVEPIECIPCNRFFATPRSFSIHQRMVHGFLDRTNRKRGGGGGGGGSRKVDFNDGVGVVGVPTSDGEENTDGDDDNCKKQRGDAGSGGVEVEGRVTVVGPLENIVSEPDLELLNEVAPPKHFQGIGVSASSSSSSKNAWDDGGGGGELSSNEDLVFCVATKKDETDRVTRSEAIKFRVSLQTEEVLVTRVLGTNVANGERCFLYKCHWCSEIVVSLDALLEHIAAHARNQQKTVMCYNCGQLFCGGERGVEELKEHLRVYHGNGGGITAASAERSQHHHQHELVNHESRRGMISQCDLDDDDDDDEDGNGDRVTAHLEVNDEEEEEGGVCGGNSILDASIDINEVHREESVQLETSSKSQLDDSRISDIGLGLINGSLDAASSLNVKLEPANHEDIDDDDDDDEVHVKLEPPDDVKHDLAGGVREECSSPREGDPDCVEPPPPPAGVFFPELSVKTENHVGGGGDLLEDGGDEDDEDGDDEDGEDDEAEEDLSTAKDGAASTLSPSSEVVAPSVVISEDGTRGYQCNVCQKLFERLFSLNRHLRGHTGFKPCYCRECGKGFSEPRNLRHHVIRFHSDGSLRHLLRRRRYGGGGGGGEGGKKRRTTTTTTTPPTSTTMTAVSDRSPPDGLLLDDDYSSPDATIYSELSADGAEFGCQSSTGSEIPEIPLTATQQGHGQPPPPPPPLVQSNPWDDDDHHHQHHLQQQQEQVHHHHHHNHQQHHHHQQQQQLSSKADDDSIVESDSKCFQPHPHHQLVRHLLNQTRQANAGDALCAAAADMNSASLEDDDDESEAASMAAVDLSLLPARSRTFDDSIIGNMHASSSDLPSMSGTNYMTEQECSDEQLGQSDFQLGGSVDSAKSRKTKRKSGVYLSRYLPRLDIVVSPVMRSKSSTKVLPNGKTVFTCLYCRKVFATSSDLNRHMDFHEDLRPYKCEFCDYCSRTNSQLKVHMMRHQGIKQYPCEPCKYFAVTSSDLNRHKKSQGHLLRASKFDVSKADKSGTGGDLEESSCSMDSGDRRSAVRRMKREDGDEENDDDDNDGGEGEDSDLDLQDDNAELDAAFNDICDGDDVLMAP